MPRVSIAVSTFQRSPPQTAISTARPVPTCPGAARTHPRRAVCISRGRALRFFFSLSRTPYTREALSFQESRARHPLWYLRTRRRRRYFRSGVSSAPSPIATLFHLALESFSPSADRFLAIRVIHTPVRRNVCTRVVLYRNRSVYYVILGTLLYKKNNRTNNRIRISIITLNYITIQ